MGRFLSPDPYAASGGPSDPGSWNRYAYVGGDPINHNDPGGMQSCDVLGDPTPCPPPPSIQGPGELPGTHHIPGGEDPQCMILYLEAQGGNPHAQQMFELYCGSPAPGAVNQDDGGGVIHTPDVNNLRFEKEFDCAKSGTELFADLKDNFSGMASYQGRFGPGGVPLAYSTVKFSGTVSEGSTINITDYDTLLRIPLRTDNVSVQVINVSSNSFTFATLPGHVLYPATISFSVFGAGSGKLGMSIIISGNFSSASNRVAYGILGGDDLESRIWNNLIGNVQKDCNK